MTQYEQLLEKLSNWQANLLSSNAGTEAVERLRATNEALAELVDLKNMWEDISKLDKDDPARKDKLSEHRRRLTSAWTRAKKIVAENRGP
jgi:chromosome segregation ATPase